MRSTVLFVYQEDIMYISTVAENIIVRDQVWREFELLWSAATIWLRIAKQTSAARRISRVSLWVRYHWDLDQQGRDDNDDLVWLIARRLCFQCFRLASNSWSEVNFKSYPLWIQSNANLDRGRWESSPCFYVHCEPCFLRVVPEVEASLQSWGMLSDQIVFITLQGEN